MKIKRILTLPFAFTADVFTCGNYGNRLFTQQVFDAERREQEVEAFRKIVIEFVRAARSDGEGGC